MITALHRPDDRLLLVLQFWKGDQAQAMRLARFIADLQPGRCNNADFLFVSRFDCGQDGDTIAYVSKKFNVFSYVSKRRGTGWPDGCNNLWFSSIEWAHSMIKDGKVRPYKALLTFEADCVPLASNWITRLLNEWDKYSQAAQLFVLGALLQAPGPHINGNAMFSGNPAFTHWLVHQVSGAPPTAGWDYVLYRDFKRWGCANLPILKSYWGTKTFTETRFNQELAAGTVFIHGVKDDSLLNLARKKFVG